MPDAWGVGGGEAVAFAQCPRAEGGTEHAGIGTHRLGTKLLQCQREVAGGTVVAFAKCGGDDQDAGRHFSVLRDSKQK